MILELTLVFGPTVLVVIVFSLFMWWRRRKPETTEGKLASESPKAHTTTPVWTAKDHKESPSSNLPLREIQSERQKQNRAEQRIQEKIMEIKEAIKRLEKHKP